MATVVIGRGIDLSMVAIMTVSVALLFVLVQAGTPLLAALALAAGAALLFGALNGFLIAYVEIPPLFTTLALGIMVVGLGQYFVYNSLAVPAPPGIGWLSTLGVGRIAGVPLSVVLFFALAILVHLGLRFTHQGRYLFAMGDNPTAARNGGVPMRPFIVVQYALVGLLAFFAGLVMATAVNEMNARIVYSTLPYEHHPGGCYWRRRTERWQGGDAQRDRWDFADRDIVERHDDYEFVSYQPENHSKRRPAGRRHSGWPDESAR
jgi:ribose transport system permease protein